MNVDGLDKMRRFFVFSICVLFVLGCSQPKENKTDGMICKTEQINPLTICLKYDEPLNGYEVLLQCKQAYLGVTSACFVTVKLKQGDKTITEYIPEVVNFERMFREEEWSAILVSDTTLVHNSHNESGRPFFDCHNILYFEDIDFDGKDELIICMSPTKTSSSDIMDCESYLAYEIKPCFLYRNDNRFTRRIAGDLCRTEYSVDRTNQTVSLTSYMSADEYHREQYWFKGGQPYKLEYAIVVGEEKNEYHFMIDSIDTFLDSIQMSRYVVL